MLTNNFYKCLAVDFCGISGNRFNLEAKDITGTQRQLYYYNNSGIISLLFGTPTNLATKYEGLYFGDGNAVPTKDDYFLSGAQVSGLEQLGRTRSVTESGNTINTVETITVQNTNSVSVTVTEIAWVICTYYNNSSGLGNFMVDRTLLDTPVTIPAGDEGVIVYKRSVTIPT